jgi:protein-S-isoprenylcysteine O-methyltransferase Ste14
MASRYLLFTGFYYSMLAKEKINTGKFGDEYPRYIWRVPRVNLLLAAVRMMRHKRKGVAK